MKESLANGGAPLLCRQSEKKAANDCDDGADSKILLERASSCPGAMQGASGRFDNRRTCGNAESQMKWEYRVLLAIVDLVWGNLDLRLP